MHVIISDSPLKTGELSQQLAPSHSVGAVCSFTGYMRNHNDGATVSAMFLDHYPAMTQATLATIASQADSRWPLQGGLIAHRVGEVTPGDVLVYVEVHSSHRQDAFDACNYIMDTLKTQAPFWKKETRADAEKWVEQRSTDISALDKWEEA